jgi:ubiquinone/menaquinone biosynthesis C-methylase UbiE
MAEPQIRFNNGAGYERFMGVWSRLAGDVFLDWLAPRPGLRWIDIGCGNGAFTELVIERCAPAEIHGIDPSEAQLAFARTRPAGRVAHFQQGDAMALPFPDDRFDAAIMALVIFFVPEPAKGVAEMARVVGPGGTIGAYAWDLAAGGFPAEPLQAELRAIGLNPAQPPSAGASRLEALHELWTGAGLEAVATRQITVERTFADFDEFWSISLLGPTTASLIESISPADFDRVKQRVRSKLPADAAGRITYASRANAVKGRMPA